LTRVGTYTPALREELCEVLPDAIPERYGAEMDIEVVDTMRTPCVGVLRCTGDGTNGALGDDRNCVVPRVIERVYADELGARFAVGEGVEAEEGIEVEERVVGEVEEREKEAAKGEGG
jgi:hypothetical protein